MIVRSDLPWPLRWVVVALSLGFSAAIALWAFEFGKDIAGVDHDAKVELRPLRVEVAQLRGERDQAQAIANAAESLMRVEIVARTGRRTAASHRGREPGAEGRPGLLPAAVASWGRHRGAACACDEVTLESPGKTRCQLLMMQNCMCRPSSRGATTSSLAGTLDGRALDLQPDRRFPGAGSCGNLIATQNIKTRGRAESRARRDLRKSQTMCFTRKCQLPIRT